MNPERILAYINLINQLLACPNGKESQILSDNRELVDAGLLQGMAIVAKELEADGNQNQADFLRHLGSQLAEVLGIFETPTSANSPSEDYEDFLKEVLQATLESQGNPEVVYPLLAANQDKLDDNLIAILQDWAEATIPEAEASQAEVIATVISEFGNLIEQFPLGNKAANMEISLAGYEISLTVFTRHSHPEIWAEIQKNLGEAYRNRIKGDKAENLETAIAAYKTVLEVPTKEVFPTNWAGTQNNLGTAYWSRISGDKAENLDNAIAAFKLALEVYTKEAFPTNWAMTQNNLGVAYRSKISGDRAENLELAIAAYEKALQVYTREAFPIDWAEIQNNLGVAYSNRISGDRVENLELAIAAYQKALQVRTCEARPIDWAMTQINLGNTYRESISGDRAENLELAIAAYKKVLQVCTREALPIYWEITQMNLGNAYNDRISGDRAENLELAIAAYEKALQVCTREALPIDWAMTHHNLGSAYIHRISGNRAENLEKAIAACQKALQVRTREALPIDWAMTQSNLGTAYIHRISGNRAENLELGIDAYKQALEVYTPQADPVTCLAVSRTLGNLHFTQGDWQDAINAYKQAITAVELSRSWSQDDERRQEILADAIIVYANIVQCFVNLKQYLQAFEYAERSRSRQLVDLMASKDLYHQGEIPPEVEELLKQFDTLERKIDRLRYRNQSPDKRETADATTATRKRAAWEANNEEIAKLEAQKQQVYRQIRKLDRVLAEQIQVAPLEFARLQQLIEDDTTGILSFYSTDDDTHVFIVRRSEVDLHTCQEQGARELQISLRDNWLKPYLTPADDWQQQMPSKLAEISQRLQLDKLVEKLDGIQELILIPHLYLHQIPFAALPLADNQYFGDKFLIRTQASCQVLDFCRDRPPLESKSLTYGIVEDTTQNLPCTGYEGRRVAEMYQVAESQYLRGSQATVSEYKKLLPQVQGLLSTHHAQSRLDNNLESALILADGSITLGQLLSPAFRFPDLDEVFLSCCETNLGLTGISDNMMTLNTGFLCAGARGAVSTLWKVNDLATSLFSVFYHQQRQGGKNRPQALQAAQQQLRQLTREEFTEVHGQDLEKVLEENLREAQEKLQEAKQQRDAHPKDSREYRQWEQERIKWRTLYRRIKSTKDVRLEEAGKKDRPFAHPIYWSGFICAGLR